MRTSIRTGAAAFAIIGVLALPATAAAGGWATVRLSSTPDAVAAGATWSVDIEVLQHGRTPLDGIHPTVTITSGGESRTFTTRPTGRPGTHHARVTFPRAGTWSYVVDDGFSARHGYPPVRIGDAAGAARGRETVAHERLLLATLAGLATAGLTLLAARGRRRRRVGAPELGC